MSPKINSIAWLPAQWKVPAHIHAGITTRSGGYSVTPYDALNLADHVGDNPECVGQNRELLRRWLGLECQPSWLIQQHGSRVIKLDEFQGPLRADGAYTTQPRRICAVLTADCLPLLLCDRRGTQVAAVHIGWRGFSKNIIAGAISMFSCRADELQAWMGPAISGAKYQVGPEVRAACQQITGNPDVGFRAAGPCRWQADLAVLARSQLNAHGIMNIHGGEHCTYTESGLFYSYRRDGLTGRMASLIWIE